MYCNNILTPHSSISSIFTHHTHSQQIINNFLNLILSSMQINTQTMPLQNPTEPDSKSHFPESEKPLTNHTSESTQKPHETGELPVAPPNKNKASPEDDVSGRERLKRHRVEVAGRVWVPDMWGQEGLLKDWIDCAAFDASLVSSSIMSARDSLMEEGRRANSARLRVHNGC